MGGVSGEISVKERESYQSVGADFHTITRRRVGMENMTLFWEDEWMGQGALKHTFHRLFQLDEN